MKFTIYTDEPVKFTISCDSSASFTVAEASPVSVVVSVFRDGNDGRSAFQEWLDLGNVGDEADFIEYLKGADAVNNTLEAVRAENPVLEGDIDANGNTIQNLRNATENQQPITKAQADANLATALAYADTVSANTVRWAGYWDASTGSYPTGIIRRGDEYEVSVAGGDFEVGDIIRARINAPGQIAGNWSAAQGNVQQSTESRQGTAKVATAATASNENTTNDTDIITGKKLWQNFWQRVLALSWTWNGKQIFLTAPRISSVGASQYLKTDSNKDVTTVSSIPAADITQTPAARMHTDAQALGWNAKVSKWANGLDGATVANTIVNTITYSQLIPGGTIVPSDVVDIEFRCTAPGAKTSASNIYISVNTTNSLTGATLISGVTSGATARTPSIKRRLTVKGATTKVASAVATITQDDMGITAAMASLSIDWTVDQHIIFSIEHTVNNQALTGDYYSIKK